MITRSLGAALLFVLSVVLPCGAQPAAAPPGEARARAEAFFAALASGDAAKFEAMAQDQFSPELLARRGPQERKGLLERMKDDFGQFTLAGVEPEGDVVRLNVRGSTGLQGRIELVLDPAPPHKVARLGVEVGGPADGPAEKGLPAPGITPAMTAGQLGTALDAYLQALAADGAFSGVVLVARDGVPAYQRAFGIARRDRGVANTLTTRFSLGSINKAFTKVAIGQLVSQGRLSLSDTIGTLLPDYPNADARVATVEQLLTHRAGIADFFGAAFAQAPKDRFTSNAAYFAFVAPQPLLFPPGTRNQYCNGCYVVLGAIVEKVSGMRYEEYVAEHVFRRAGMSGAGFFRSDQPPSEVAIGYTRRSPRAEGTLVDNAEMHGVAGSAAGGAYATVSDLLAFDNALRGGRLLDAKSTAWFFGSGPGDAGRVTASLGVAGGAPGVNASMESGGPWAVVVLANLDPPAAEQLGRAIGAALIK